jgi:hypothetical protein
VQVNKSAAFADHVEQVAMLAGCGVGLMFNDTWPLAANANDPVLPVQIVEPQADDFSGPQPVSDKQQEDRAVALVYRAITPNRGN